MNHRIWTAATLTVLLIGAPIAHAKGSKSENVGIGIGAVVGAVAGGPVGFFVGSAAGAFVGDRFHQRGETIEALDASLHTEQRRVATLTAELASREADLAALDRELAAMQVPTQQARHLLASGLAINLLFGTNEAALDEPVAERIVTLGERLAEISGAVIELNGHADSRGAPDYNLGLSMRRAENVRALLIEGGFPAANITVTGHGATEFDPAETRADSLAAQRRVDIRISVDRAMPDGQLAGL